MAEKKNEKKSSYISAKKSREISRFNRKLTKKLEKERNDAGKDPALYTTKMADPNNVVEFDNVCTMHLSIRESESEQLIGRLSKVEDAIVDVME